MAKPALYVESCCFIDLAKSKLPKSLPAERRDDVWYTAKLLEAAFNDEVEIFVSSNTVAECTHADGDMSERTQQLFVSLLTSGQYTKLVEADPFIAQDARDLRWKHGIALRGMDGIHVASALAMKCEEFLTTDNGIVAQAEKIAALGMRVIRPHETRLLPAKYRQEEMFPEEKRGAVRKTAKPTRRGRTHAAGTKKGKR